MSKNIIKEPFCRRYSSERWLARHSSDPYVKSRLSSSVSYRSRSAFKLLEIMQSYSDVMKNARVRSVVDLGAAPGGWSQVLSASMPALGNGSINDFFGPITSRTTQPEALEPRLTIESLKSSSKRKRSILAVDRLPMAPIAGVHTLKIDFLSSQAQNVIPEVLRAELGGDGRVDMILSDMMSNTTGNRIADVEASLDICRAVLSFSQNHLRSATRVNPRDGVLLLKYFESPEATEFRVNHLQPVFRRVQIIKPPASRTESSEYYWLCWSFSPRKVHYTLIVKRL
ncbi:ribosomal RNA methyltransferase FtsJ domain-containing protein [Vararia minispora EC-137]|uniref:Ribosomal RNA methyltransferase FtsJ domain-containing protein n=1 Tax=Vararia minispora EC-137 TaxID=1314806 RepID=A0ACB8QA10_9AGAM|nr:ribosomal RNA methyltransferase FtsJ domain-containing protein [Vararia minispora EC-137]